MDMFERLIAEPFERLFEKVLHFLPNLLVSFIVLLVGIILAVVLRFVFTRIFRAVGIDRLFEKSGTAGLLQKGGIKESVSGLLARLIEWTIIIIFMIISVRAIEAPTVERILERLLMYLPNMVVSAVILFFGYVLSSFLGRAALIAAVNAGIMISGLIGKLVRSTVFMLAVAMALEQLGIGRGTVVVAFSIILGGVVLALSLAFGLGGKDLARDYLEKKLFKKEEKDTIEHL
jgi:hypothetical protein